jgi:nicotinamidase-related amidase
MMTTPTLAARSAPFLDYLDAWLAALPQLPLTDLIGGRPERVALIAVDMINGFCKEGPLSGPRVGALIAPVVTLFNAAHALGVRAFVLTQDTHPPDTPEFASYPPHCIIGTPESQAVDELKALSFADRVLTFEKNSLSSHINTEFGAWVRANPQIDTFIVSGDCTDLCIYSAAMHLRMEANAHGLRRRVIVPANAVDTYDTPVTVARELGINAHDADLHHALFLHHMAANGVEVVRIG